MFFSSTRYPFETPYLVIPVRRKRGVYQKKLEMYSLLLSVFGIWYLLMSTVRFPVPVKSRFQASSMTPSQSMFCVTPSGIGTAAFGAGGVTSTV